MNIIDVIILDDSGGPELVIIRGIPGSGKSTLAKTEFPNHVLVEADQYFVDDDGQYVFDRSKLKQAHEWCQVEVKRNLNEGKNTVVANTFVHIWEMQPYLYIGDFTVKVVTAKGNYGSIHNPPVEVVERMRREFEEFEG